MEFLDNIVIYSNLFLVVEILVYSTTRSMAMKTNFKIYSNIFTMVSEKSSFGMKGYC